MLELHPFCLCQIGTLLLSFFLSCRLDFHYQIINSVDEVFFFILWDESNILLVHCNFFWPIVCQCRRMWWISNELEFEFEFQTSVANEHLIEQVIIVTIRQHIQKYFLWGKSIFSRKYIGSKNITFAFCYNTRRHSGMSYEVGKSMSLL